MSTQITIVDPTSTEPMKTKGELAPRLPLPEGWKLLLLANGKPGAKQLLDATAAALSKTLGPIDVISHMKRSAAKPLDEDEAARISDGAAIAIAATGDCGACSACTIDDTAQLERLGIPTMAVITEPFQSLSARFAVRAGIADLDIAFVPHPVATRSDEVLAEFAATIAERVTTRLIPGDRTDA